MDRHPARRADGDRRALLSLSRSRLVGDRRRLRLERRASQRGVGDGSGRGNLTVREPMRVRGGDEPEAGQHHRTRQSVSRMTVQAVEHRSRLRPSGPRPTGPSDFNSPASRGIAVDRYFLRPRRWWNLRIAPSLAVFPVVTSSGRETVTREPVDSRPVSGRSPQEDQLDPVPTAQEGDSGHATDRARREGVSRRGGPRRWLPVGPASAASRPRGDRLCLHQSVRRPARRVPGADRRGAPRSKRWRI